MKVHLVDGTYELFRAFYGAPSAMDGAGREIGAARALLRSMMALIRDGVSHIGAAFDTVIESFRNDMFNGYKTGEGIEPDLRAQFELAERVTAALGITVWSMIEFEADDALATAAWQLRHHLEVEQVVICSPDKDLAQCVRGQKIVCFDRMRERILDEDGVLEKYGVPPASIPDWLGLVGDTADGIPGIPKWGAKSAATVLRRYGHIGDIPDNERAWDVKVRGAAGLAANLRAQRKEAMLYKALATLRVDVPLAEGLDDLQWRGARRADLVAICRELGMEDFIDRVPRWRKK